MCVPYLVTGTGSFAKETFLKNSHILQNTRVSTKLSSKL